MNNPFSLSFGKKPEKFVSRPVQADEVVEAFTGEHIPSHAYMLVGVRGCGKTVLLSEISGRLSKDNMWQIIDLNPERDMLIAFAAKLHSNPVLKPYFIHAKLDLSVLGIGVSIEDGLVISDVEAALERMLGILTKKGYHILVTVDEVSSTKYMKEFASAFQILIRQNHSLFLIMTGLYDNINSLQNGKNQTFLYRTPKIYLEPLNITSITAAYRKTFNIDNEIAQKMAYLTRGYAFAFQVLGYLTWTINEQGFPDSYDEFFDLVRTDYEHRLQEYVYIKLWSELSAKEQQFLKSMASHESSASSEIRESIGMNLSEFSVYRDRLLKKGILTSYQRGSLSYALPMFSEYINTVTGAYD